LNYFICHEYCYSKSMPKIEVQTDLEASTPELNAQAIELFKQLPLAMQEPLTERGSGDSWSRGKDRPSYLEIGQASDEALEKYRLIKAIAGEVIRRQYPDISEPYFSWVALRRAAQAEGNLSEHDGLKKPIEPFTLTVRASGDSIKIPR
jgi:hypothetical protein